MSETNNRPIPYPDPTPHAEFRAKLGPADLQVKFPSNRAKDPLPLFGVVAGAAGPPLIIAAGYLAGIPWGISLLLALVQLCGTVFMVNHWRT